jgi:hypothetical protein
VPSEIAFDFIARKISKRSAGAEVELYTDLSTDTMYKVVDTEVLPEFEGSYLSAVYTTGVVVLDNQPTFAWLRIEGPVTSAVAKIYGDGGLFFTTPTITGNSPVRVPSARFREWEIRVESAGRCTDVTLASSSAELL